MSDEPKSDDDQGLSRRGLLGKAAVVVGAATSLVAARSALARPSNIVMDSSGRVLVDGAALPAEKADGRFQEAKVRNRDNTSCTNSGGCGGGSNTGCQNTRGCVKAKPAMGTTKSTGPNMNMKANSSSGGGKSRR